MIQLCKGFKALAEKKVIYRDLKPENIKLHNVTLKFDNFTLAKHSSVKKLESKLSTMLGTSVYMSPTILKD